MKEFLTKHGVAYVSVNVLEDKDGFAELEALGVRSVPIVRRGRDWANGQVLREVARVTGVAWGGVQVLPASELAARLTEILTSARRLFAQIPEEELVRTLPHRPRSYAQLAYHIFNIADAFLEHEVQHLPLKEGAYDRVPPPEMNTKTKILAYGQDVSGALPDLAGWPGSINRFFPTGRRLLWGRDAARVSGADHLAFGPARAPACDGAGDARHCAEQTAIQRNLCRPADARQGLG